MKTIKETSGIKAWAEDDRPREKMVLKGKAALSDAELIAILIGSGTRDQSAVDVSKNILAHYSHQLDRLGKIGIDEFTQFKGIGQAKAISIIAALELGHRRRHAQVMEKPLIRSSHDSYQIISSLVGDVDHEQFWVLLLNRSNHLMDKICISRGGVSGTVVDQRFIFKPAIEKLASGIVVCHNHPSGNLKPSQQDIQLTKKVVESGRMLDIPVLDHIIFTEKGYYSFADEGLLRS